MAAQDEQTQGNAAPITIMGQYVRDISFENPNAPDTLFNTQIAPQVEVNFGMGSHKIENDNNLNMFEVNLTVNATAKMDKTVAYICEVQYAVLVALNNIPEEFQTQTLMTRIPDLAFPFVRQIISDLTQNGGYSPLLLNPVDFNALYLQRAAQNQQPNTITAKKEAAKA
jgi:preprotein translocase subunit SecB